MSKPQLYLKSEKTRMQILQRELTIFFADKTRALSESLGALTGKLATLLDLKGYEDNITNFLKNNGFYDKLRSARAGHVGPVPATAPKKRVRPVLDRRHVTGARTAENTLRADVQGSKDQE